MFPVAKKILAAAVAVTTVSGCSLLQDQPDIKLYIFQCGEILARDVSLFSPGVDQGKEKLLTDSCYLIRHPQGDLVWDTGLPDSLGTTGADPMEGAFHVTTPNPFAPQLAALQIKPADIQYLGISHFHFDHTGNANLFTGARLLIQQEEYAAAFGNEPQKYGFEAASYDKLDRSKIQVLNGDYDVFGDGRVVIKKAVGHTPGHQMLFVDLANTGPVVLSGDLYHFTSNREHRRVPSFNFSKEQTEHSMETMEKFVQEKKAQFWIQHDREQNQTLKHAPEFYN